MVDWLLRYGIPETGAKAVEPPGQARWREGPPCEVNRSTVSNRQRAQADAAVVEASGGHFLAVVEIASVENHG